MPHRTSFLVLPPTAKLKFVPNSDPAGPSRTLVKISFPRRGRGGVEEHSLKPIIINNLSNLNVSQIAAEGKEDESKWISVASVTPQGIREGDVSVCAPERDEWESMRAGAVYSEFDEGGVIVGRGRGAG